MYCQILTLVFIVNLIRGKDITALKLNMSRQKEDSNIFPLSTTLT